MRKTTVCYSEKCPMCLSVDVECAEVGAGVINRPRLFQCRRCKKVFSVLPACMEPPPPPPPAPEPEPVVPPDFWATVRRRFLGYIMPSPPELNSAYSKDGVIPEIGAFAAAYSAARNEIVLSEASLREAVEALINALKSGASLSKKRGSAVDALSSYLSSHEMFIVKMRTALSGLSVAANARKVDVMKTIGATRDEIITRLRMDDHVETGSRIIINNRHPQLSPLEEEFSFYERLSMSMESMRRGLDQNAEAVTQATTLFVEKLL